MEVNVAKLQKTFILQPGNVGPDQSNYGGTGSMMDPEEAEAAEDGPDNWRVRVEHSNGKIAETDVPGEEVAQKLVSHIQRKRFEFSDGELGNEILDIDVDRFVELSNNDESPDEAVDESTSEPEVADEDADTVSAGQKPDESSTN